MLFFASTAILPALTAARLTWDQNPEPDIAGYEVRYGTQSGNYTSTSDVGQNTSFPVSNLTANTTYFLVVVAYNRAGVTSLPSAEIAYQVPPSGQSNRGPSGSITSPRRAVTILSGGSVEFAASANDPDGDQGMSYFWNFGSNSGIAPMTAKDPGSLEFNVPGSYLVTMTATNSMGVSDPTPETIRVNVVHSPSSVVPRNGWTVKHATSEETGYEAGLAFDGDPSTFWHTRWLGANLPPPPHEIQIDTGTLRTITGFQYVPRQDELTVGNIGRYEFYVSADGVNWGAPVANGNFTIGKQTRSVYFPSRVARYVRLVSLTEVSGKVYCSVAELNVLEVLEASSTNRAPVALPVTASTKENTRTRIKLRGSDADGNSITYQIIDLPSNGTLWLAGNVLTYWPNNGFTGTDRLNYRVHDGQTSSKLAAVTIQVTKAPPNTDGPGKDETGENPPTKASAPRTKKGVVRINGKKYRTLRVAKKSLPRGAKLMVQVSPNLTKWFSGGKHTTVMKNSKKFIKIRDNTPFTAAKKRHIRLRPVKR